jgi:hypothetical protein
VTGDFGLARVQGAPQGRLLDKRPGEGVVFIPVGVLDESAPGGNLSVWLGVCPGVCCRVGRFNLMKNGGLSRRELNGSVGRHSRVGYSS